MIVSTSTTLRDASTCKPHWHSYHSPKLIDNMYIKGIHSVKSATASAFLIYLYIPYYTDDDIINILTAQLDEMQKHGAQTSSDNLNNTMTLDPISDTHLTTYPDDEHITQETNITSPHLEGVPHAHIMTLPTCTPATYGLTLLAKRQLR